MNDIDIKNTLERLEVEPSPRCWQAVESQLAAGMGAAATSEVVKSVGRAAWLSTTAAKITLGAVSALLVASGVTLAVLLPEKTSETVSPVVSMEQENVRTACESEVSEETAAPLAMAHNSSVAVREALPVASAPTEATQSLEAPSASPIPNASSPVATNLSQPVSPASVAQVPSVAQKSPPAAPASETVSSKSSHSSSKNIESQIVVSNETDPVLEQSSMADEFEFSAPIMIEIPNVMTPNGDGYNDFFIIKGIEHCEKSRILIKNRAGVVVFQGSDYRNNWDAAGLSDGTYYYQFYYTLHGIEEVRTGTLTILR